MKKFFSCFFVILLLSACSQSKNSTQLNLALTAKLPGLDPATAYDTLSATVLYQCYETLFEYHYLKRPYTIKPLLAKTLPLIENNGTRYIITIRDDVRYHNDPAFGNKPRFVKAQDFVNQIKRMAFKPTQSSGWWMFDGKIKGLNEFRQNAQNDLAKFKALDVAGLSTPNDHTLIIDLLAPYPQMIYALTMSFTAPIPIELIEKYNNRLDKIIVGTGPFRLKNSIDANPLILTRFEHYRADFYPGEGDRTANELELLSSSGQRIPFVAEVHYHLIEEAQERWQAFKDKKLDFLLLPKDNYDNAIDKNGNLTHEFVSKHIKLQLAPTLTFWWISFNMQHPLLGKNIHLRKAIAHAIDIEKYINLFTNNVGQKANSIYPPGLPGYNPSSKAPYEYNLSRAKEYLKKAGFPNGKGLPPIIYDTRGVNTTNQQQAQFIKDQLKQIGINVKIELNSFANFLLKTQQRKFEFFQGGWSMDYPDAENVLQLLTIRNHPPGPNATLYTNHKFDDLFARLQTLPNGPEKFTLMEQMENIVHNDLPWIMLFYSRNYVLYHDHLKNFRYSDVIHNYIKYLKVGHQ